MKVTLIFLLSIFSLTSIGQDHEQSFHISYGTSRMDNLEEFINGVYLGLPNSPRIEEFPSFIAYEIAMRVRNHDTYIKGFWLRYQSNKGGTFYNDPSFTHELDLILRTLSAGLIYQEKFFEEIPIWFDFKLGAAANFLQIKEKIITLNMSEDESFGFRSISLHLSPGLSYRIYLKKVFFELNAYYNFGEIGSEISLDENKNINLLNHSGEPVKVDWSGFGIGFGVGFIE